MSHDETIIIRAATDADTPAMARVAALDSARPVAGPALVAEVDGRLRAALQLDGQLSVADPFAESAHILELLHAHAHALGAPARRRPWRGLPVALGGRPRRAPLTARP